MKVEVGKWVAFNHLDDAAWFKVEEIDGTMMRIREDDRFAAQYMDKSLVKQVRNDKPKGV